MNWYLASILLIVGSNVFYNLLTKAPPAGADPLAALVVTYLTAAAATFLLLLASGRGQGLGAAFRSVNWTSLALGFSIIGLEFGYIQAYRAGWNISVCSLAANIALAVILLALGLTVFRERLSGSQFFGVALCLAGLFFINRR